MAIKTKDELVVQLTSVLGDNHSDEALALFDDLSDTIDSLNSDENIDYKKRYEENDAAWRKKYRDRFTQGSEKEEEEETEKAYTYENLFKEEK